MLGFARAGAALDAAIERSGKCRCRPISPANARPMRATRRLPDVFSRAGRGAVAAPTASLHFTPRLVGRARRRRHRDRMSVTLHVGAGTFLPVKAADTQAHRMHAEWGEIDAATADALNAARAPRRPHRRGRHDVACGSSKARRTTTGTIAPFAGETAIFITPGYRFRAVDLLLTNFHLPRSTLFMLVARFRRARAMQAAYAHAIAAGYRFYSYGDACLLYPAQRGR